jgi:lysophospholipase L1-like esterase
MAVPRDYDILVSSNSTRGYDGSWILVASIRRNTVTARGHVIAFTGASWVKMSILAGGGKLDEIEVFDVSRSTRDIWFFTGTSISANTFKDAIVPADNFADRIAAAHPGYHPAMIRGGIGCINSSTFSGDISRYLDMTRNVRFWAVEMGTNDAWGGSDTGVTTFIKNMQVVIDSCKAAGIQPIIARIIATDSLKAGWEVNPAYLKAIDSLTRADSLIAGPDLYSWFRAHPGDLNSDGVHPNGIGGAAIQKLWADKMGSLYTDIVPVQAGP